MKSRVIEIVNKTGLHTRPGNLFVKEAKQFESEIWVKKGEEQFNAKSLLKLMKVGVSRGDKIEIICEGPDEDKALDSLCELIASLEE
ncbi:MAG: HPr family phosphocarrier protein [Spirochaetes bacterium]|nr:HPr family phosphocarrier protein [Spirochaetota bacterium]